ncbi:unnamed protein product (macronuclear) [Paramecium tetraurelia]|uniref:HMG box domain-containing protein n=1 Tax=Paramecium tetraurelia TaxID=5888 RepID=A0D5A7_PARTE|nr:uncharacterized protein GSPATT00013672001 [Paramecium tetraurelia]CAK78224.1 unnamed protein product [Paramecium tetraurelia]|eukprot:XP_001445621.1 hypothetical protein (macronuclear) [Paramecium tetraurelia strain d4-2]
MNQVLKKLLRKYQLVGNQVEGKYLIPNPPSRVASPFILFLNEQQKQLKSELQQKVEQRDIIKLLNQHYKLLTPEQKQKYFDQYRISLLQYMQAKRIYDYTFKYNQNNGIKKLESAYVTMKRSEKRSLNKEQLTIEQIREQFGKQQFELSQVKLKDATPEELEIVQQVFNMITLRQIQIKINCQQFRIPDLFNQVKFKKKCKEFTQSFLRQQKQELTFQQYLIQFQEMKEDQLIKYNSELLELSKKLNDDPSNVELAIILNLDKPKKKEEISRKRSMNVDSQNKFLNVLTEYFKEDP